MSGHQRSPSSRARFVGCLGGACLLVAGVVFGVLQLRELANRNAARRRAEIRQGEFNRVKQGDPSALVLDSKLLPMLASDRDCKRIVTQLVFATTDIDAADAKYVAQLRNVTSISFYCTTGTKNVLLAARSLPITDIYFEMPDLTPESYLILKDFPQLKMVRFEHLMADKWIERLKSELPDVTVDAPYTFSEEAETAK